MSATEKISVTIGREELAKAKRLASHLGVSLSGFITDAVRERIQEQARREAVLEVLATFAPQDHPSPGEARALLEHWASSAVSVSDRKPAPRAKRRRKAR